VKILPNNIAVLENDSHISRWVEETGKLDHDEYSLPIILKHIKEGDYVVDAGAFIGDHTVAYAKAVGSTGRVYAFEPNLSAYECLVYNCPSAITIKAGLSDKPRSQFLSVAENAGASRISACGDRVVPVVALDSYDLPKLDFFKLDVEGFEVSALKGAKKTITKHRPIMWIEVNEHALQQRDESPISLITYLRSELGYGLESFPPEEGPQYDLLCKPL